MPETPPHPDRLITAAPDIPGAPLQAGPIDAWPETPAGPTGSPAGAIDAWPEAPEGAAGSPVGAIHPEDPSDEWPDTPVHRGVRLRPLTAALLALAVLAGGFWGGAVAEQHHGSGATSGLSALASRLSAARAAGSGTAGSGTAGSGSFAGRGGGSVTTGLVTAVKGSTLYLTLDSGKLVEVTVGPSAQVTRSMPSDLTGLRTGDTVAVRGSVGASGNISAVSVTDTGHPTG